MEPRIKNDVSIFQDIETFDLEAFKYNFVNITAFRAVDSEYFRVNQLLKEMERSHMPGYNNSIINRTRILQAILSGLWPLSFNSYYFYFIFQLNWAR